MHKGKLRFERADPAVAMKVLQSQFLPDTIALQRNAITKGKCGLFQTSQTCLAIQLPPTGFLAPDWTNFQGSIILQKGALPQ